MGLAYLARAQSRKHDEPGAALLDLRAGLEQEMSARKVLNLYRDDTRLGYVLRAQAAIELDLAAVVEPALRDAHVRNAAAAADEALQSAEKSSNIEWCGLAHHFAARVYARVGRYGEAQSRLTRAVSIWKNIDDSYSLGLAHLMWAQLVAMPQRDYANARQHFDNALQAFDTNRGKDEIATVHLELGRLHEATGNMREARRSYLSAIETVEQVRALLSADDNRLTYFARRLAPYEALITLLLRNARSGAHSGAPQEDIDSAFRLSERSRARALMDNITRQPERAVAPGSTDIPALPEGDIVVQYFIGVSRSFVFVLQRGQPLRATELNAPREIIAGLVRQFRKPFEAIKTLSGAAEAGKFITSAASFDMTASRDLYDRLLRPVQAPVASAKRLVIVPHGPLFLLPFEALAAVSPPPSAMSFSGSLTKTRFALDTLPPMIYAVSAGMAVLDRNRNVLPAVQQRMVAFIDPVTERAPLRHARAELTRIEQLFRGRVNIHRREAATRQRFLADAGNYDSLYVSTHGEFNELSPWLSGFWLSEQGKPSGVLMTPADIARLRLRAGLVTVRACEVAVGRVVDGEGVIGLARALKVAGAQNMVMSLWVVDDQSSAALLPSFYRRHADMDLARALHAAKLELRNASSRLAHPFFWAPFILMQ